MPPVSSVAPRVTPKIGKNVFIFASTIVLIVISVLSAFLFAVAKSGAVRIPMFSYFYQGPKPTRHIEATTLSPAAFEGIFQTQLASQMKKGVKPPYVISITEAQLTGVLGTVLSQGLRDQGWKEVDSQIVIRPTDLEFSGQFVRGILHQDLLVRLVPRVQGGRISFETTRVQIGDYTVPSSISSRLLGLLFARDLGTWSLEFGSAGLRDIRLSDGTIDFLVAPQAP